MKNLLFLIKCTLEVNYISNFKLLLIGQCLKFRFLFPFALIDIVNRFHPQLKRSCFPFILPPLTLLNSYIHIPRCPFSSSNHLSLSSTNLFFSFPSHIFLTYTPVLFFVSSHSKSLNLLNYLILALHHSLSHF